MIVSCPSCQTRYRHAAAPDPALIGQCGQCDETFPMAEARRSYVVLPGIMPRPHVQTSIGMDDPVLADKLGVPAGERDAAASPRDLSDADDALSTAAPGASAQAVSDTADATRRERSGTFEILVAVVPTAAGAGLAYYLADLRGLDSITWAAVGGAIGLLLGWGCLLWNRPRA